MMIRFAVQEDVHTPVEFVFDALVDLQSFEKWKPGLGQLDVLSGDPYIISEYSMWRETRTIGGRVSSEVFEVKLIEPERRLALKVNGWKGTSRRGAYYFDYFISPVAAHVGQTRVLVQCEIVQNGWYGFVARVFLGLYKRNVKSDLFALKRFSESRFRRSL